MAAIGRRRPSTHLSNAHLGSARQTLLRVRALASVFSAGLHSAIKNRGWGCGWAESVKSLRSAFQLWRKSLRSAARGVCQRRMFMFCLCYLGCVGESVLVFIQVCFLLAPRPLKCKTFYILNAEKCCPTRSYTPLPSFWLSAIFLVAEKRQGPRRQAGYLESFNSNETARSATCGIISFIQIHVFLSHGKSHCSAPKCSLSANVHPVFTQHLNVVNTQVAHREHVGSNRGRHSGEWLCATSGDSDSRWGTPGDPALEKQQSRAA